MTIDISFKSPSFLFPRTISPDNNISTYVRTLRTEPLKASCICFHRLNCTSHDNKPNVLIKENVVLFYGNYESSQNRFRLRLHLKMTVNIFTTYTNGVV